ncbi:hypothetical protein I3842_05G024000 [Carya illinoinensis]|uniref:SCP domain-containing protein n=1 Tax=Carya illinoinensis TaxID=32201 RepID=A0A922JKD9_CARIL|nr:hypothetical protein I3842_05G024000 [Carya illinoinensis]
MAPLSLAQNSPQDYIDAHNAARKQVGVQNMTWDTTVAGYAQNYANTRIDDCNLVHSSCTYGENLAKGSGSFTGTAAVNLWVAEKPYYYYSNNSCVGGLCLNYTQSFALQVLVAKIRKIRYKYLFTSIFNRRQLDAII